MNRTIRCFVLFCIILTIPLALSWATWEGNAGTGVLSDFPGPGLFARSDMFPRNTVVHIQNLETGSSVRAVITGSSGVAGLVAVLSPDTASALNIRQGAVIRVRITIPVPVPERAAPGTFESGDSLRVNDPDVNPQAVVPLSVIADSSENPMIPVTEVAEVETFDDAHPSLGVVDHEAEEYAVAPVAEPVESSVVDSYDDVSTEQSFFYYEESPDEALSEVPGTGMDQAAISALEDPVAESITASEEAPAPELASSDVFYDEPAIVVPESEPQYSGDEVVTLEPAELMPPESEQPVFPVVPPVLSVAPETVSDDKIPEVPADDTITIVPDEKPVFAAVTVPVEKPVEKVSPSPKPVISTDDFPWVNKLLSGSFYIQVAAYSDNGNVRSILDKYGKKYPIVVQQSASSSKSLIKVFIGPLKKDEYGAVLEFFRKNGFKDAFVRQEK